MTFNHIYCCTTDFQPIFPLWWPCKWPMMFKHFLDVAHIFHDHTLQLCNIKTFFLPILDWNLQWYTTSTSNHLVMALPWNGFKFAEQIWKSVEVVIELGDLEVSWPLNLVTLKWAGHRTWWPWNDLATEHGDLEMTCWMFISHHTVLSYIMTFLRNISWGQQ